MFRYYLSLIMVIAWGVPSVLAAVADHIKVSARKYTLSRRRSSVQDLPRGPSRSFAEQVQYEFRIKAYAPAVAGSLTAEWAIMVEKPDGRIIPGAHGRTNIVLRPGRQVSFRTAPVLIRGREWIAGPRPGTVQENIAGWALRLLRSDGSVLYEEYQPDSLQSLVDWQGLAAGPSQRKKLLDRLQRLLTQPANGAPDASPKQ